jgi:hypothetical protein
VDLIARRLAADAGSKDFAWLPRGTVASVLSGISMAKRRGKQVPALEDHSVHRYDLLMTNGNVGIRAAQNEGAVLLLDISTRTTKEQEAVRFRQYPGKNALFAAD